MKRKKAVVSFSGGMDSTTLLYWLMNEGYEVFPISINYGQRHKKEMGAAAKILNQLKIKGTIVEMQALKRVMKGSSQTDDIEVPEGHYEEESMKLTVVPNRNMILLSIATAYAISMGVDAVAYAAHAGDHAIYPDCRPEFINKMSEVMQVCDYKKIELKTPFIHVTKKDIAILGKDLEVPFEATWTCYKGLELHCGECGACTERREALDGFDPTKYAV